jgi:hypothetical protein
MKETIGKIFIILAILILSNNCNKERILGEKLLSPEILSSLPFKGTETLVFIKDIDTLRLKCEFLREEKVKEYPTNDSRDYYILERIHTLFRGNQFILSMEIITEVRDKAPKLLISFVDTTDWSIDCTEGWWLPLDTSSLTSNQWFVNEMVVQSHHYDNVYCALTECSGNPQKHQSVIYYYTKENGLIKFEYEDGSAWELLEVEW